MTNSLHHFRGWPCQSQNVQQTEFAKLPSRRKWTKGKEPKTQKHNYKRNINFWIQTQCSERVYLFQKPGINPLEMHPLIFNVNLFLYTFTDILCHEIFKVMRVNVPYQNEAFLERYFVLQRLLRHLQYCKCASEKSTCLRDRILLKAQHTNWISILKRTI